MASRGVLRPSLVRFTRRVLFRNYCNAESGQLRPLHSPDDRYDDADLSNLLEKPTWSVESLLPPKNLPADAPRISAGLLHHLLRLSALPLPESAAHEASMLDTLSAQLHFVGEMQRVDTEGVEPLRAIRDETEAAEDEHTITMEALKDAFAKEKVIGKHYKRIQRDSTPLSSNEAEDWPVMASAERKMGKYFVVESERPQE